MLAPGTRIGPYEVTGQIGAGGMGEVYRAHDHRLGRDVALKVLPASFSTDAERLARFQREAQVLAALQHPNIGAIYGIEDSALVLELIEGETLADRIGRGPIPVREALPLARQIAEALEAAHEQGIVHRDLKPANIRITPDGVVKVLDFGLAKLNEEPGTAGRVSDETATRTPAPAVTSPALMTGMGMILGTAAYMAPEQAKGRAADKRSDIWAFGCVLYEMLTGVPPFKAEDVADTIALVLTHEPDWTKLPQGTPRQIRRLLRRALQKDRKHRLADAADARLEIEEAMAAREPAAARQTRTPRLPLAAVAAVVAIVTALATWLLVRQFTPAPSGRVTRLTVTPARETPLNAAGNGRSVAITADGSRIVYRASGPGLVVRALDDLRETPIAVGNAVQPFVSPDGQWIGFFDGLQLRKVAMSGGPSTVLSRLDGPGALGASWGEDNTIVFGTGSAATGLQRVSADGGEAEVLTRPNRERNEADHGWPSHLPGGRGVLFTITPLSGDLANAEIAVLPAGSTEPKVLMRGASYARYVSSGHLVYLAGDDLRAVAFDLNRLEVSGDPVALTTGVRTTLSGAADFDVAPDGTLVYVAGGSQVAAPPRTLSWIDRATGEEDPVETLPPGQYQGVMMSPDGTRVAVDLREQGNDIWIWNLQTDTFTRLTFGPSTEWWPAWMPDGERLVFGSNRAGTSAIYVQAADGSGTAQKLVEGANDYLPTSVSPDGQRVLYDENSETFDLMSAAIGDGEGQVIPLLQTAFDERYGMVSPDGRWMAYQSNESGRNEIYVRPFPNIDGGRWQVSTQGGVLPLWAPSGDELLYMAGTGAVRQIMAVRVGRGSSWVAGRPQVIAEGAFMQGASLTYAITPDGRRLLVIKQEQPPTPANAGSTPTIVVVQNWHEDLRRRVAR